MKNIGKKLLVSITVILFLIVLVTTYIFLGKKTQNTSIQADAELLRELTYARVQDGDSANDTGSPYINFDAFFLRDLDADGNAEGVRGTCNEIGKEDTLYIELNVLTNGRLEDGVITINSDNFYFKTAMPKDDIIKNNVISDNAKSISLNTIQNGNQKLFTGIVEDNIGSNINNYSKINSVTLTGKHIADDGTITNINKTVEFTIDWYGNVKAKLPYYFNQYNYLSQSQDLSSAITEGSDTFSLAYRVCLRDPLEQLILKNGVIESTIPELNGYKPTNVYIKDDNYNAVYNSETAKLTITKEVTLNADNSISNPISNYYGMNLYVYVDYPINAYDELGSDTVRLEIPIEGYFEAFNNDNEEFDNPVISNKDENVIIVTVSNPQGDAVKFNVITGEYNYYFGRRSISKEPVLSKYNGTDIEEKKDNYLVTWKVSTGTAEVNNGLTMREVNNDNNLTFDELEKSNSEIISMENISKFTGIYLSNPIDVLGEDGWIKVYNDDTDKLEITFNKENWKKYSKNNPYTYENGINHIRIETSKPNTMENLLIYNIKTIDDDYIINTYSKEEFDEFKYINSYLTGYVDNEKVNSDTSYAVYDINTSIIDISTSLETFSTQKTEKNVMFYITAKCNDIYGAALWQNGIYLIELPSQIIDVEINDIIGKNNLNITNYEVLEIDGKKCIKIYTNNDTLGSYSFEINADITPNPLEENSTGALKLYAYNEACDNYMRKSADIYDIDSDNNTTEDKEYDVVNLKFVSPNSLLTCQIAKNYDENGSVAVAPQIAIVDKNQRTATLELEIANNYTYTISEVSILGKVPNIGNTYVINGGDLGSNYSVTMSNTGIVVPNELSEYAKIYYSEKDNVTKEIGNSSNGWTLTPTDFSKVKSYLIVLENYVMQTGESQKFTYDVSLPSDLEYNQISYAHHAVSFALDTPDGKYKTQTEPNKLGLMVAELYSLDIVKYQTNKNRTVDGAVYSIVEDGEEDGKTETTKNGGVGHVNKLYVDRTYIIKEIKSPLNYQLNNDEIKFRTTIDENGILKANLISGNLKSGTNIEVVNDENNNPKVVIQVEDEINANLKIIKTDKDDNSILNNIFFELSVDNKVKRGKTDNNGELIFEGLTVGKEYTLTELKAKRYYLIEPVKFVIENVNGTYTARSISGNIATQSFAENNDIPCVTINIENTKIPTYNLQIIKKEKDSNRVLNNAMFSIESEDDNEIYAYSTDENGCINTNKLYLYENRDGITGRYTIKELRAPDGYVNNSEEISFYVQKDSSNKLEIIVDNKDNLTSLKDIEVEDNTIRLIIEDKPKFKITKVDSETGEPLANVKFSIYSIDQDGNILDFAKNTSGNYIGVKDDNDNYVVKTDENGEISIDLLNGLYKVVEVETLEQYKDDKYEEIVKIGEEDIEQVDLEIEYPSEYEYNFTEKNPTNTVEVNYIEDLVDISLDMLANNNTYENTKIKLMRDLDFEDDASYKDSISTSYKDLNGNSTIETIKEEVNDNGFWGIGFNTLEFKGVFDGQNNKIKNYKLGRITNISNSYYGPYSEKIGNTYMIGFFNKIDNAEIKNLNIEVNEIKMDRQYMGCLVGVADNSYINNCSSICNDLFDYNSSFYVGRAGIVGCCNNTIVENCDSKIDSDADNIMYTYGGIVGICKNSVKVKNCSSEINVNNISEFGGIVRKLEGNNNLIEDCKCTGVTCDSLNSNFGAIVSWITGDENIIRNCSNVDITYNRCIGYSGGIIAKIDGEKNLVENCNNNINFSGNSIFRTGGIVSYIKGSNNIIKKCNNYGSIISDSLSSSQLGGIIAETDANANNLSIINCKNFVDIKGQSDLGGIIGLIKGENCNIINCYSECNISGKSHNLAGIIGNANISSSNIIGCSFLGDIDSTDSSASNIGGIVGNLKSSNLVKNCKVISGNIHGYSEVGGIIGKSGSDVDIENCYNNMSVSATGHYSGGILGNGLANISNCINYGLILTHFNYDVEAHMGGIAGQASQISNCKNYGMVFGNGCRCTPIAGIAGQCNNITNCSNYGNIKLMGQSLYSNVGGIVGSGSIVSNCINAGKIEVYPTGTYGSSGSQIGGIAGSANTVRNCFNKGEIISNEGGTLGGIVGRGNSYSNITVYESYNIANIINNSQNYSIKLGGVLGYGSAIDCYNLGNISNISEDNYGNYIGGIIGEGNVTNSYNAGSVVANNISDEELTYNGVGRIIGKSSNTATNSYYLNTIEFDGFFENNIGNEVTDSSLRSINFYNVLNINDVWIYDQNEYPKLNVPISTDIGEITSLRVNNDYKKYNIITKVKKHNEYNSDGDLIEVKGGTISGEEDTVYETVKYKEDSTKEIKMIPDNGYEIAEITINGEIYDFTPESDGTVTLPQFVNMQEDKIVVVRFALIENKVIINKVDSEGNKLKGAIFNIYSDDLDITVETNSEGQAILSLPYGEYSIKEIKAPEGYELDETIRTLTVSESSEKEVTIENNKKASVLTHHYIKGTTTKVAEDDYTEGNAGDTYTTKPHMDLKEYRLERDTEGEYIVPDNASGVYVANTQQVVTYFYENRIIPLIVHHYIEGTTNNVPLNNGELAEDITDEGIEGTSYTTSALNNLQNGYVLVSTPENANGIYSGDKVEVTYYYRLKTVKITTEVKEHEETNELGETINVKGGTISGDGQNPYETVTYGNTSINDIVIQADDNYVIKEVDIIYRGEFASSISMDPNATGKTNYALEKFESVTEDIHIQVIFEKAKGNLIVHHYIEGTTDQVPLTNGSLAPDEIYIGEIGIPYTTSANSNVDSKYELVAIPENATGNYAMEPTVVTYFYKLKTYKITTEVKEHEELNDLDEIINVKGGEISGDGQNPYETVVCGNDSVKDIVIQADDNYVIKKLNITYIGVSASSLYMETEAVGKTNYSLEKFTNVTEDIHIDVEFERATANLTVHHYIEGTTNRVPLTDGSLAPDENYEGKAGKPYTTSANSNIDNKYELVAVPENATGNYAMEPTVVTYFYKLKITSAIVNYLEIDNDEDDTNNTVLHDSKTIENLVVDSVIRAEDEIIDIPGYVLDSVSEDEMTIKLDGNILNIYYRAQYNITTEVIPHEEKYIDGTIVTVKGGTVSGEDEEPYETVLKNDDSKKIISIIPDEGYMISKVIIKNGKESTEVENIDISELEPGDALELKAENGYFENVETNKHVVVEFTKLSKVIVKYLSVNEKDDEGNNLVLAEEEEIIGYENKEFETVRKPVLYYKASEKGITDESERNIEEYSRVSLEAETEESLPNAVGTMYADTLTIVYWYERIPSGIIVKHIEIDEDDIKEGLTIESGKELDSEEKDGFVSLTETTKRNEYDNYIAVDGPESTDENLIIAGKDEDTKEITYKDEVIEVRYYYEKKFKITTEVRKHTEKGEEVSGGKISGEDDEIYETVNSKATNKKEIVAEPDYGYRIKSIEINKEELDISKFDFDKDSKLVLPEGYFEKIENDIHVVVEYERIPAKVIVKYIDIDTKKEILEEVVIDGFVKDEYKTERKEIKDYEKAGEEPENSKGNMTEEDIVVIYYYKKVEVKETPKVETKKDEIIKVDNNSKQEVIEKVVEQPKTIIQTVKTGDNLIRIAIVFISSIVIGVVTIIKRK